MNIVFWFLVLYGAVLLWLFISPFFRAIGSNFADFFKWLRNTIFSKDEGEDD